MEGTYQPVVRRERSFRGRTERGEERGERREGRGGRGEEGGEGGERREGREGRGGRGGKEGEGGNTVKFSAQNIYCTVYDWLHVFSLDLALKNLPLCSYLIAEQQLFQSLSLYIFNNEYCVIFIV